jgi:hypothetical protein
VLKVSRRLEMPAALSMLFASSKCQGFANSFTLRANMKIFKAQATPVE